MSLVSGPGRGGTKGDDAVGALPLCVAEHVKYIQSLDTVRHQAGFTPFMRNTHVLTAKRRTRILADRAFAPEWSLLGFDGLTSSGPSTRIAKG